jgi:hypothetical protein
MKKEAFLSLIGLILSISLVFCQVPKDTFSHDSALEDYWQIYKDAYKRQLETQGMTSKEIEKRLSEYEEELKEKTNQLRKHTDSLRQRAYERMKQADILMQKATEQKNQTGIQIQADEQRIRANEEGWKHYFSNTVNGDITISPEKSKIEKIKIKVDQKNTLFFSIHSYINSGNILIEIFNPKGKIEGTLTLEHQKKPNLKEKNGTPTSTCGVLNKTFTDPEIGNWLVKISPYNADGRINIFAAQIKNTTINE